MEVAQILHAIALGALQGVAEFLPISSSAHLIIVSWLMDGKPLPLTLNIALHVGTLVAVLVYFWKDWLRLVKAVVLRVTRGERSYESDTLLPGLIIGSIPAGVIGVLWNDKIEQIFHHPGTTILPLAIVGVLLWLVDKKAPAEKSMRDISIKDAFLVGIGQACALIPGFSRSGSTILAGRLLKIRREDAARFSFLLGTPAMLGAALLKRDELIVSFADPQFIIGASTSMIVGCLTIGFLLHFLRRFGFGAFAIYRVALALVLAVIVFG